MMGVVVTVTVLTEVAVPVRVPEMLGQGEEEALLQSEGAALPVVSMLGLPLRVLAACPPVAVGKALDTVKVAPPPQLCDGTSEAVAPAASGEGVPVALPNSDTVTLTVEDLEGVGEAEGEGVEVPPTRVALPLPPEGVTLPVLEIDREGLTVEVGQGVEVGEEVPQRDTPREGVKDPLGLEVGDEGALCVRDTSGEGVREGKSAVGEGVPAPPTVAVEERQREGVGVVDGLALRDWMRVGEGEGVATPLPLLLLSGELLGEASTLGVFEERGEGLGLDDLDPVSEVEGEAERLEGWVSVAGGGTVGVPVPPPPPPPLPLGAPVVEGTRVVESTGVRDPVPPPPPRVGV